jgi:cation:H+ antiporter
MLLSIVAVLGGLALLVWSADRFVHGAAATARNLGVAPLLIGLTVVGVGTSAPEILISALAAWNGNPGVAVGNAIGSNIANIGLVLGVTALVIAIGVQSQTLRREFPLMLAISVLAGALLLDSNLDRVDGLVLVVGFVALLVFMVYMAMSARRDDPLDGEFDVEIPRTLSTRVALGWTFLGLVVLLLSSKMLVWGAVEIARALGVSDLVIGLTIVAIGTSLPELAASVTSALKGEPDIAIGNVIGSNMFNMLPVLALPGIISPGLVDAAAIQRDVPTMLGLTLVLFVMFHIRGAGRIHRWEGGILLVAFFAYQSLLFAQA